MSHVVTLQSLTEDRLGEELSVVWELEVGNTVAPDQGLPETISTDDFDEPSRLAAFIDAVRWGAVTSADANSYQAPFRSGANVEAYQLEPLRRALQSPRTNLLLADDVGLGKTIEAGLVIQELLLRHRARSVVVVCPPSLALKWQDEMREKFGLEFTIVNSELMAQVRRTHGLNANPFRLFPRVIVSMAWLPKVRAQRLLRDVYASAADAHSAKRFAFDVLVVDEAHHVAPSSPSSASGRRGYAVDSQRTIATRALAEQCEHRLFLSATPHNGYTESFTALLEMIDGRRFGRGASLDEAALRDVTVRRLKAEITEKGFKQRALKAIPFDPDGEEQERFAQLCNILAESAKANNRPKSGDLVAMLLKKRFLSSPWAFARTLGLYAEAAATGSLPNLSDDDDYFNELLGTGQDDEEEGHDTQPEFETLRRSKASDPLTAATPAQITSLVEWGRSYEHRPDSRLEALINFLDATCRPDGTWSNERVVVFTEYAATLDWISGILNQKGYGDRLATIQGSTALEEREDIRARFTSSPVDEPVRVLVATDSAGEGIDLQDYCHRLVNFDVPFNPSRLEQRIGRIDRYGQRQQPEIYQFAPVGTSTTFATDMDFMRRIAEKVGKVASDLGSVNYVIDGEIQQHFSPSTAPKGAKDESQGGSAIITKALAGGIELNKQLTELSRSYGERKEAMHLTPFNAERVVSTALELSAQPPLIEIGDERTNSKVFSVPELGASWQAALRGIDHRLTPGVWRPISFDDAVGAETHGDVVHIHLGHALMQKSSRMLRSSLFATNSQVHRVTAVVVPDLPDSCVAAVSRLVLVGRGGIRLHEEVFLTGVRLRGQKMAEAKVEAVLDSALDKPDLVLAPAKLRRDLVAEWEANDRRLRQRLLSAMEQKSETRRDLVTKQLEERRDSDVARAREIFGAFRLNLQDSIRRLDAEIQSQDEMLFSDEQQGQRRRDLRALQDRLANLQEEESREVAAIKERYSDIRPHISAAAVVFAITSEDAASGRWSG